MKHLFSISLFLCFSFQIIFAQIPNQTKTNPLEIFHFKKNDNKLYDFLLKFDRKFGDGYSIHFSDQPVSKSNKGYIIAQNDCEYPMVLKLWKPDAFLPEIGHTNCEAVIIQPTECVLIFSRDIQSGIGYNVHNIIPKNVRVNNEY